LPSLAPQQQSVMLCHTPSSSLAAHLPFVSDTVDKYFPLYEADGKVVAGVKELLNDHPGESLLLPAGLLAWSGILANWDLRCQVKFQGSDPGWHRFSSPSDSPDWLNEWVKVPSHVVSFA